MQNYIFTNSSIHGVVTNYYKADNIYSIYRHILKTGSRMENIGDYIETFEKEECNDNDAVLGDSFILKKVKEIANIYDTHMRKGGVMCTKTRGELFDSLNLTDNETYALFIFFGEPGEMGQYFLNEKERFTWHVDKYKPPRFYKIK